MSTFNITFNPIKKNVLEIFLSMPYDYKTIKEEFDKEDWIGHEYDPTKAGEGHNGRFFVVEPKSPILKEVHDYVSSDAVKKQVIDEFYKHFPEISYCWDGWKADKMYECTLWGGALIKDHPGFFIQRHLDTRLTVIAALIYLMDEDDPDRATYFYDTKEGGECTYRSNTSFGKGILFFNDYDSFHEVKNNSQEPRQLIIMTLVLDVKNHSYC